MAHLVGCPTKEFGCSLPTLRRLGHYSEQLRVKGENGSVLGGSQASPGTIVFLVDASPHIVRSAIRGKDETTEFVLWRL